MAEDDRTSCPSLAGPSKHQRLLLSQHALRSCPCSEIPALLRGSPPRRAQTRPGDSQMGHRGSRTPAPHPGAFIPTHTSRCAHGTCAEPPLLRSPGTEVSSLRARCQCQGQPFLTPSSSSPGTSTRSSHMCSSTCPDTARGLCPPSSCSPAAEGTLLGVAAACYREPPRLLLPLGSARGSWLLLPTQTTRRATTAGWRPAFYYYFF